MRNRFVSLQCNVYIVISFITIYASLHYSTKMAMMCMKNIRRRFVLH
jgi:hypothetical protein